MNYFYQISVLIIIYSILGLSLNLVVGLCGRLSLCQAAFYGLGAYGTSLLFMRLSWPYFLSMILAALTTALFAYFVGILVLKFKGDVFVLVTIGVQAIIFAILFNCADLTGGSNGVAGIPRPTFMGFTLESSGAFLLFSFVVFSCIAFIYWQLIRTPYGRALRAVRDDSIAATSLGMDVVFLHASAFAISAFVAALAGSLWAMWTSYIDPTNFTLDQSIFFLLIVIVGGTEHLIGPIFGAFLLVVLPEIIRFLGAPDSIEPNLRQIAYGIILIMIMRFRTDSLLRTKSHD